MKFQELAFLLWLFTIITGCGTSTDSHSSDGGHHHDVPPHLPTSLADLCQAVETRLQQLEVESDDAKLKSELTDLISWTPEFAADTDMSEQRWIPIYELSEELRLSIDKQPRDWNLQRLDQITRLCQISRDAWRSLEPQQRIDRYQGHDHGDEHGHGDEHDHGDEHEHDHGDEHDHGQDEHPHDDGHGHHQNDKHDASPPGPIESVNARFASPPMRPTVASIDEARR